MNPRLKTSILILVLGLIAVLITGLYLELMAGVINYDHPQVNLGSNKPHSGSNSRDAANFSAPPVILPRLFEAGSFSAVSFYPLLKSTGQAITCPAAFPPTPG